MKPRIKLAETTTPDGGKMEIIQHDQDFLITVNGQELMNSRQHASEMELARLGCAFLMDYKEPRVLIGGLGMGYTLHQTLKMLSAESRIEVSELLRSVVEWNREYLSELNEQPLADERVEIKYGDIIPLISGSVECYDAILLDIDNGPSATTDSGNHRLYGHNGIQACRRALRNQGCLAVWSIESSKSYEYRLVSCGFHVRRYRAPAFHGSKSRTRFVWVASENERNLPPGGGEPR